MMEYQKAVTEFFPMESITFSEELKSRLLQRLKAEPPKGRSSRMPLIQWAPILIIFCNIIFWGIIFLHKETDSRGAELKSISREFLVQSDYQNE